MSKRLNYPQMPLESWKETSDVWNAQVALLPSTHLMKIGRQIIRLIMHSQLEWSTTYLILNQYSRRRIKLESLGDIFLCGGCSILYKRDFNLVSLHQVKATSWILYRLFCTNREILFKGVFKIVQVVIHKNVSAGREKPLNLRITLWNKFDDQPLA